MKRSSSIQRGALSATRSCPPGRLPRAHYELWGTSVDVTDLLNSDFELIELVERAIAHLGIESTKRPVHELLDYAEQVLTLILDLQADRVMELMARLTSAGEHETQLQTGAAPVMHEVPLGSAEGTLHAQCAELNRLKNNAQPSDYATLKTGGHDRFSGMRLDRLADIIPAQSWAEMQIRLRAAGLLTPVMELRVARWIARGLDVSHAIEKVKWDVAAMHRR